MKVVKTIGIYLLALLFACNYSDEKYELMDDFLQQAETIYQHPDGERSHLDSDTLHILNKLKYAKTVFIKQQDYSKAARTALLIGYAQKEANNKSSAMKSFKDAELYGSIAFDSLTTARAQLNIARFLFEENAYEELMALSILANENFRNHYGERAFVYNLVASSYILQKDYNNAELYLKQALIFAEEGKSRRAKQKILNNYSIFHCKQGNYGLAMNCLKENITETDSNNLLKIYANIGDIYIYQDMYDSAAIYIQKSLDISKIIKTRPETQASLYFSMYYTLKKQEDYHNALKYFEQYNAIQYNYQKEKETKNLYNIQQQYDYEVLQNQMRQKIIGKQRIILIISFLLLLASMFVIGLLLRQKKILEENERIRKELDETKAELQKSVRPEMAAKELSRQLHLIITANNIADTADDFKKEWSTLVYRINNEKNSKFEAALDAIEHVYPDMYATIQKKHPNLNETESKVMVLSCSDLSNKEIAGILGLSIHTVNKCRSGINRKII